MASGVNIPMLMSKNDSSDGNFQPGQVGNLAIIQVNRDLKLFLNKMYTAIVTTTNSKGNAEKIFERGILLYFSSSYLDLVGI